MKIIAGIVLCLFGMLGTLANWEVFLKWKFKNQTGSMTPFVGGFMLSLGTALLFPDSIKIICLVGMTADIGSLPWAMRMPAEIVKIIRTGRDIKENMSSIIITVCFSLTIYAAFAGFVIYVF